MNKGEEEYANWLSFNNSELYGHNLMKYSKLKICHYRDRDIGKTPANSNGIFRHGMEKEKKRASKGGVPGISNLN